MKRLELNNRLLNALVFSSLVSFAFFAIRVFHFHTSRFWFLNWNLLLAWVPLGLAVALYNYTQKNPWVSWKGIILTVLWLGFLPNSFYIASDLVHLQLSQNITLVYDVALILSFALNGLVVGYMSIYFVHLQLIKRLKSSQVNAIISVIFLLCGFAIYLGRYLRWSTWDVLINPAGLLFDVSDRFLNPGAHEQTFETTILFFALFGSLYIVIWQLVSAIRHSERPTT